MTETELAHEDHGGVQRWRLMEQVETPFPILAGSLSLCCGLVHAAVHLNGTPPTAALRTLWLTSLLQLRNCLFAAGGDYRSAGDSAVVIDHDSNVVFLGHHIGLHFEVCARHRRPIRAADRGSLAHAHASLCHDLGTLAAHC